MAIVVGIDVAGEKKGHHAAAFDVDAGAFLGIWPFCDERRAVADLKRFDRLALIAIDCPPRATILGPQTRQAERELHRAGFHVQWTRRPPMEPQEWMVNGERLWRSLERELPHARLIETFPTVAARGLDRCDLSLPLALLSALERKDWKDALDACLCAWVGARFLKGEAQFAGEQDELGPIWY